MDVRPNQLIFVVENLLWTICSAFGIRWSENSKPTGIHALLATKIQGSVMVSKSSATLLIRQHPYSSWNIM